MHYRLPRQKDLCFLNVSVIQLERYLPQLHLISWIF